MRQAPLCIAVAHIRACFHYAHFMGVAGKVLPWSLVVLRLLLAPTVAGLAETRTKGVVLASIVFAALLSDIYDGVLARRWNVDTPAIRLADSLVDTVFYLGVLAAVWLRTPQVLRRYWPMLAILILLEGIRYAFDLYKFGKAASYHSYLAKTWGLVMAVAVMLVLGWGRGGWMIAASLALGIVCDMEGFTMSLILPVWRNDVKTVGRALAIRRNQLHMR